MNILNNLIEEKIIKVAYFLKFKAYKHKNQAFSICATHLLFANIRYLIHLKPT